MKRYYTDIISRIPDAPEWFDENGTPRYDEFHPDLLPDIYAREACLLVVRCQACGTEFRVGMSWSQFDAVIRKERSLRDRIASNEIEYGDPPNMECCAAGPTMNSEPVRVLEFWESPRCEWERSCPELERDIKCDWVDEEFLPEEAGKP